MQKPIPSIHRGLFLALLSLVCLFFYSGTSVARPITAKGAGYLFSIPIGRDSVYVTDIIGINDNSQSSICFKFSFLPDQKSGFFPPLPSIKWIETVQESLCAAPLQESNPLQIITSFPMDSTLFNRRFGANVQVSRFSRGSLAMNINLSLFMETESRRFVSEKFKELQIAPIRAPFTTNRDSILVFNNTRKTDTIEVFWTASLNSRTENPRNLGVTRRFLIWHLPVNELILGPGKKEWIYFKKPFDYSGSNGYIVLIGRSQMCFCDLRIDSDSE
ncbi:MAG TPA: hypothetical protein ENN75_01850 [candidate division Zixibacteria bacterium]|nr:hypothetical protein [candidate division Zixibacteria bacterium]